MDTPQIPTTKQEEFVMPDPVRAQSKFLEKRRKYDVGQLLKQRDNQRARAIFDLQTNFSRAKNTSQSIIRTMNANIHKKYYEFILGKLKFEKELSKDTPTGHQRSGFKLPPLVEQDRVDDEHQLFKSLNMYIKNEDFLIKNKKLISNRNQSFERFTKKGRNVQSQKNLDLSQFVKSYDKKINLIQATEDNGDISDVLPTDLISIKKNKQLMDKIHNLMHLKSKNKIRWEQQQKQKDNEALRKKEEEEKRAQQELLNQLKQQQDMISSAGFSSIASDNNSAKDLKLPLQRQPTRNPSKSNIKDWRAKVEREIKKEHSMIISESQMQLQYQTAPPAVEKSNNSFIQDQKAPQPKQQVFEKKEANNPDSNVKNKIVRVKVVRQESLNLPIIVGREAESTLTQERLLLNNNESHRKYQSSIMLSKKAQSFLQLPKNEGSQQFDIYNNLSPTSSIVNKLNNSQIKIKQHHLEQIDNVLDNCQHFLSGNVKSTKNSLARLERFIRRQGQIIKVNDHLQAPAITKDIKSLVIQEDKFKHFATIDDSSPKKRKQMRQLQKMQVQFYKNHLIKSQQEK